MKIRKDILDRMSRPFIYHGEWRQPRLDCPSCLRPRGPSRPPEMERTAKNRTWRVRWTCPFCGLIVRFECSDTALAFAGRNGSPRASWVAWWEPR